MMENLDFYLKFTFVTQLLFYSMCREKMKKGEENGKYNDNI